jgi:hypothetical protein
LSADQPVQGARDGCDAAAVGVNPYAPKPPHFKPRATAVISLFMGGGWSQVDTFDPKPALAKYAGEPIDGTVQGDVIVRQGFPGPLMPSPFSFRKYGQSGIEVSELFPHLSRHVDGIAFLRSVYGRSNDHVQGTYEMQTGQINLGFPSVGSWVTYGLGSVASSLPAYVVMTDARGGPLGGPNDWSAGFIPAAHQGTLFRSTGDPIVDLKSEMLITRSYQCLPDSGGPFPNWQGLPIPRFRFCDQSIELVLSFKDSAERQPRFRRERDRTKQKQGNQNLPTSHNGHNSSRNG